MAGIAVSVGVLFVFCLGFTLGAEAGRRIARGGER